MPFSIENDVYRRAVALGVVALVAGSTALAQVPTYSTFELQARSNLCANPSGAFNLPCNHFFNSSTVSLNDAGQIAVKLDVMGSSDSQGVLLGQNGSASIIYTSPAGASISDAWINNNGYIVWPQTFSAQNGVYFHNSATSPPTSGWLTGQPFGASAWGSTRVNDAGQVSFRATFPSGGAYYSYDGTLPLAQHAIEAGLEASPYSFLFSPSFNNNRQVAAKVRIGAAGQTGNSQPDQIRIFNADGTSTLIAVDRDGDPNSLYTSFDNSVAINDHGWVAFTAPLFGGGRGVFLSNGVETKTIATTLMPEINVIEFFPPALNDNGLVAFRARDGGTNFYSIWVGDGAELRRVIGQWDQFQTDQGFGQIAQHDTSVTFGGGVSINSQGDIAFNCALTPAGSNQIEWGSGIVIAYADQDKFNIADLNQDGIVNVDDLLMLLGAWGTCSKGETCIADIAPQPGGDGQVNVDDLLVLLSNWG